VKSECTTECPSASAQWRVRQRSAATTSMVDVGGDVVSRLDISRGAYEAVQVLDLAPCVMPGRSIQRAGCEAPHVRRPHMGPPYHARIAGGEVPGLAALYEWAGGLGARRRVGRQRPPGRGPGSSASATAGSASKTLSWRAPGAAARFIYRRGRPPALGLCKRTRWLPNEEGAPLPTTPLIIVSHAVRAYLAGRAGRHEYALRRPSSCFGSF
jgi:hypothetical protein